VDRSVWFRWPNLFMFLIPVVIFHDQLGLSEGPVLFVLAGLSLIPLAGFLKSAVEELEELLGEFIGAFLHTTSGNAAELAIAISVLLSFQGKGGSEIVLGSIAGVIVRTLLFLGLATFLGCLKQGHMKFDIDRAGEYSTVLALAVTGICLPTLAAYLAHTRTLDEAADVLVLFHRYPLSLCVSIVLLVSYLAYIAFAVFRVRAGINLQEKAQRRRDLKAQQKARSRIKRGREQLALAGASSMPGVDALFAPEREKAERELEEQAPPSARRKLLEEKKKKRREAKAKRKGWAEGEYFENYLERTAWLRGVLAFVLLVVAAAGVVYMSEAFAGSIEHILTNNPALKDYEFFIGLIIIPVLGGLVELVDAVEIARRGVMDVTMAMTAGGSVQMILLVTPILVITGFLTAHPLDLFFKPLEVIIFGAATFIYMLLSRDGESTFLEGLQLCFLWLLLAVVAFFLPPA